MASGRFKDLSKALHTAFASQNPSRTPSDEFLQTVQAYLEKHDKNEDSDAARLQEELLDIHAKYVAKDDSKLALILLVLQSLRPAITGQARKVQWWNTVLQPVLNSIGHRRDEIDYAGDCFISFVEYDPDEDTDGDLAKESARLGKLLLSTYIKRTRIRESDDDTAMQEDEFIAHQLEHLLARYGRKNPKDYMNALAQLVYDSKTRTQALGLLCSFVRHQPPHLYTISETPLLDNLLKCLLIDTSATSVQLALTSLIMFIPHIPSSLAASLPRLFLVYSRLLCWDRLFLAQRPAAATSDSQDLDMDLELEELESSSPPLILDHSWQRLGPSPEAAETLAPNLTYYFTFLYGLYPINFMNYIRAPKDHLRDAGFANAGDYDLVHTIISQRTEQFQRGHLMHPNFFLQTRKEELQDDRWIRSDPADVVAACIGLRVEGHSQLFAERGPPPQSKLPSLPAEALSTEEIPPQSLLNHRDDDAPGLTSPQPMRTHVGSAIEPLNLSRNNSQRSNRTPASQSSAFSSPALRSRGADESPTLPPAFPGIDKGSYALHSNRSNASFHSGDDAAGSEGELSTTLKQSHFHSPAARPHSPAVRPVPPADASQAYLQREVLLLRNDLNFERYLKQQHLSHIGQLQRRHIKDATRDAEHQNLLQNNKTLRAKLAKANEGYLALKTETANDRMKNKQSESSLSFAVRNLREDEQKWRAEESNLRLELKKAHRDCDHLRHLVVESEAQDLLSQQKVAQMEIELETVSSLRERVRELEARVKNFEMREVEFVQANDERDILKTELATVNLQLQSRDNGTNFAKKNYERRIFELETRLSEAQNPEAGKMGEMKPGMRALVDNAVAASNAKLMELKKEHVSLKLRHAELELRCQQLEQELSERGPGGVMRASMSWPPQSNPTAPARPARPDSALSASSEDYTHVARATSGSAPQSTSQLPMGRELQLGGLEQSDASMGSITPSSVKHALPRPPTIGSMDMLREGSFRSTRSAGRTSRNSEGAQSARSSFEPKRPSGVGLYQNSQSAFSAESLVGTEKNGKSTKGKAPASDSSSSISSKIYGRGGQGASTAGKDKKEVAEQKREWREKGVRKIGSLRGIRGII